MIAALLAGAAAAVLLGLPVATRPLPVGRALPVPTRRPPVWTGALPGLLLLPLLGPAGAVVVVLLGALGWRAWGRRGQARAAVAERAGAVEALAVLGSELRVGRSPAGALAVAASVSVGPFAQALHVAARSFGIGADPVSALRVAAVDSAAGDALRGLAACLAVCSSSGSSLALAVETVADALRADHTQRLVVEAELAGPRATALMLAGLPVAGTLLAAGLGAHPLHVLLHTAVGGGCLLGGVGLDLLGLWWTGRLVAAASP